MGRSVRPGSSRPSAARGDDAFSFEQCGKRAERFRAPDLDEVTTADREHLTLEMLRDAGGVGDRRDPVVFGRDDQRSLLRHAERSRQRAHDPVRTLEGGVLFVRLWAAAETALLAREVRDRREWD